MQLQCICTFVYKNYLLAQFIHLREVPDGCASQGGRVLHKNHLAFVFLHTDNLAVQGPGPDVMERHLDVFPRCRQAGDCTPRWQAPRPGPTVIEVSRIWRCSSQQGGIMPQAGWDFLDTLEVLWLYSFNLLSANVFWCHVGGWVGQVREYVRWLLGLAPDITSSYLLLHLPLVTVVLFFLKWRQFDRFNVTPTYKWSKTHDQSIHMTSFIILTKVTYSELNQRGVLQAFQTRHFQKNQDLNN